MLSLAVVITFTGLNVFSVNAINLEGAERLTADIILSQLGISGIHYCDQSQGNRQPGHRDLPSIKTAKVSAGLPASLTIKITERQPLVLWLEPENSYWIDDEGVMFYPRGEAEVALTVVATGNPPTAMMEALEETEDLSEADVTELTTGLTRTTPEFIDACSPCKLLPEAAHAV